MGNKPPTLLCVSNMMSTRGYAWYFIGRLYAQVADRLAPHGIRTLVAYPSIPAPPPALEGSAAQAILLDASLASLQSLRAVRRVIKSENVRVIYFTDRPLRSWKYPPLRMAGARRIVVHDHTSGARTRPRGLKRLAKYLLAHTPGMLADVVIAVSDYVARRDIEVGMLPPERVVRVWNGLPLPPAGNHHDKAPFVSLGIAPERPHIVCACRATPEKGVAHLLRAFEQLVAQLPPGSAKPALIYYGDGPQWDELRALRETLAAKDSIFLCGQIPDVGPALAAADICVVPSIWQDAFPLAVLEAMGRGKPVVASRVGGIPEMIEDGVSGLLVPPGDEGALATAIGALLTDPARAARLAEAARRRVAEQFTPETQISNLVRLVGAGFGIGVEAEKKVCQ
jgi:glycosyltransferase involved in cell wall biosynthesis